MNLLIDEACEWWRMWSVRLSHPVVGVKAPLGFGRLSGSNRIAKGFETAKFAVHPVQLNDCPPKFGLGLFVNASHAALIVDAPLLVRRVPGQINIPQIFKSIVSSIMVYVVDQFRVFASHHLPRHSMRKIVAVVDRDDTISMPRVDNTRHFARITSVPCPAPSLRCKQRCGSGEPSHLPGKRVINQNLAEKVGVWQRSGSHSALLSRGGQGRGSARTLSPVRFYPNAPLISSNAGA
jgi:hypothetical protein